MYIYLKLYLGILLLLFTCKHENRHLQINTPFTKKVTKNELLNKEGSTIKTRFNIPVSFNRVIPEASSFANYLQNFQLKPHKAKVHLYNGELKNRQDIHAAVLDIDVGTRDLQQCADATIRLRSEYLYQQKKYTQISFNFTNGFKASYSKWRQGYRIKVSGNNVTWYKTNKVSDSYKSFRKYLIFVFSYTGTLSLEKELPSIKLNKLQIGDLFLQGGSPGHAVIVVDMAVNQLGEKIFLLAQSYMPAQEIHILKNLNNENVSPWYSTQNLNELITPEWTFSKNNVKRFK